MKSVALGTVYYCFVLQEAERYKIFIKLRESIVSYDEVTELCIYLRRGINDIDRMRNEHKTIKDITMWILTSFWDDDTSPEGNKWRKIRDAFLVIGKAGAAAHINHLCNTVTYDQTQYNLIPPVAFTRCNATNSRQASHQSREGVLGQVELSCAAGTGRNIPAATNKEGTQSRPPLITGKIPKSCLLTDSDKVHLQLRNSSCGKPHEA